MKLKVFHDIVRIAQYKFEGSKTTFLLPLMGNQEVYIQLKETKKTSKHLERKANTTKRVNAICKNMVSVVIAVTTAK